MYQDTSAQFDLTQIKGIFMFQFADRNVNMLHDGDWNDPVETAKH